MYVALKNAFVLDGTGRDPIAQGTLLIAGNSIQAIEDPSKPIPEDCPVVDLQGRVLMPGLIDLHVHLGMHRSEPDAARYNRFTESKLALLAQRNALQALWGGVTTLRDVGSSFGESIALRDAINAGITSGPRIFAAGDSVTFTGGHARYEADGPWRLRKALRTQIRNGADLIKIGQSDDFDRPGFTQAELDAICDEVHRVGKRVCVHIDREPGYLMAVAAGVDPVEHGFSPSDETLDMMVEKGIYWVPTISVNRGFRHSEHTADSYEDALFRAFHHRRGWSMMESRRRAAVMKEVFEQFPGCFQKGLERGVKLVTGTDTPLAGLPMDAVKNEMIKFVDWGMSPRETIVAATSRAAEALGTAAWMGSLEPGKRADLLILDENPLENIEAVETVRGVIKDGQLIRDDLNLFHSC